MIARNQALRALRAAAEREKLVPPRGQGQPAPGGGVGSMGSQLATLVERTEARVAAAEARTYPQPSPYPYR